MAVYGNYETVAEIGRTRATSVLKARPADGGWDLGFADLGTDACYAIKAARVRSAQDAGDEETQRFLLRASDLKKIGATDGIVHWPPVFQVGEQRGEAYYVSQLFASSAEKLLQSRRRVDAATLWIVVAGVLEGLLEIKRTLGRPHGNLKPGNVLLRHEDPLDPSDIVLTDPATGSDAIIAGEVEDLFTLGELIHQLVTGTHFAGQHTWPVKLSGRWQALGPHGPAWLDLCNRLLSPRAAEQWLRFDDLLEDVASLRVQRRRRAPRRRLAWAAILLLVAGLGAGEWFRYVHLWRNLCGTYESWAGPVSQRLAKDPPPALASDPHLRDNILTVFGRAASGEIELDPRRIAGTGDSAAALASHPPIGPGAIWKTERASWALGGVEKSVSPDRWPALADLVRKRDRYRSARWSRLDQFATGLIDDLSSPARDKQWIDAMARIVEGQRLLARIDTLREAAIARLQRLSARGESEIRPRIESYATLTRQASQADAASPTPLGVQALGRRIEDVEQIAARFESMIPLVAEASRRQRGYEVRGWTGPAKFLGGILDQVNPGSDADLGKIAAQLAVAQKQWNQADELWKNRIEKRRFILESSGDPILLSYRQFVRNAGLADQPDLAALVQKLEEINDDPLWQAAAKKVDAPEWSNFDVVAFAQRSAVHRQFIGHSVATADDLMHWLAEVDGHGTLLASATLKPETRTSVPPATRSAPASMASAQTLPSTRTIAASTQGPSTRPETVASTGDPHTRPALPDTRPAVASARTRPATRPETRPTTIAVATRPAPDPEKVRLATEIANFIIECRETGINSNQPDIRDAWRKASNRWADAVMKNPDSFALSREARQGLRGRLLQLDGAWRSASAPLKLQGDELWLKDLARRLDAHASGQLAGRTRELIDLALSGDVRFEERLGALSDQDEQWRGKAMVLAADIRRIGRGLAAGYRPTDEIPGGATVATAAAAVRSADPMKLEEIARAVEPVLAPLARVEALKAPEDLRSAAGDDKLPLGLRLLAWSKLPQAGSGAALEGDLKLGSALFDASRKAALEPARLEAIKTGLETDLRNRWAALLESAQDARDVEIAIATRSQVAGIDVQKLSPKSRFNLALFELRAVLAGNEDDLPARIAPVAGRLREAAAGMGEQDASPRAKALLDSLAALERPASADPAAMGPMSPAARQVAGGKIEWSVRAEEDGALLVYRGSIDKDTFLAFRRVQASAAAPPAYLLTSEVSVGLFDDLVTATGRWPEVRAKKLLPPYDPARGDPRPGPRAWEWPRFGRLPGITRALVWLSPDFLPPGADHYPEAIGSEFNRTVIRDPAGQPSQTLNPSRRQPMQYISATGAQFLASLAGCRLPTAAEWQAAHKSVPGAGANLRDRTWRLELEHLQRPPISGKFRPDLGMFAPAGEKPSDEVWKTPDGAELDDGVLWFAAIPADPPSRFVDLVGNVAEFVSDASGKIGVIGGSSIAPPQRPVDQVFPLLDEQLASGFADVGLRLAFSAPAPSAGPVKDAVAGNWYLTAK